MTTRQSLREAIAVDVRDPSFEVFSSTEINNLIEAGIVEVSLAYPLQMVEVVTPVAGTYYYPVRVETAFRVEVFRDGEHRSTMPMAEEDSSGGWDLHAGLLFVPKNYLDGMDLDTDDIRVWGYAPRTVPTDDVAVLELDDRAEMGVRAYARWTAFQMLLADRMLFKQWNVLPKNTDVSMTQMLGTVATYSREWDKTRNRLRTMRRF